MDKFSIPNFSQSAIRMFGALAIVLGAFMVLLWITKNNGQCAKHANSGLAKIGN
jgi:flagellar biogenesis protein FliO